MESIKLESLPLGILAFKMQEHIVDKLVTFYESNPNKQYQGVVGNNILDKSIKDSIDLTVHKEEIPEYSHFLNACLEQYKNVYDSISFLPTLYFTEITMRKYKAGAGYPAWHFERFGWGFEDRELAHITYLNDSDGGTEFAFQDWICPCRKGLTIFFPAGFLFGHRGIIDYNNEKRIVTGWVNWSRNAAV